LVRRRLRCAVNYREILIWPLRACWKRCWARCCWRSSRRRRTGDPLYANASQIPL